MHWNSVPQHLLHPGMLPGSEDQNVLGTWVSIYHGNTGITCFFLGLVTGSVFDRLTWAQAQTLSL